MLRSIIRIHTIDEDIISEENSLSSYEGIYERPSKITNDELLEYDIDGEAYKMKPHLREPYDFVTVNSYQWFLLCRWYDYDYQIEMNRDA